MFVTYHQYKKEKMNLSRILDDIDKRAELHGLNVVDRELYLDTKKILE
jgi:hypothetical protein